MFNKKKRLQHMADCIMIDTMGLRVDNVYGVNLPKSFAQVSDDPEVANNSGWAKGNLKSESGKYMSMRVRSVKAGSKLLVEGSNSMQYLDHNIVSSNDAVMTAFSMLDAVRRQHPMEFDYDRQPMIFRLGDGIKVTRIDTPVMLKIPGGLNTGAVINALAYAALRAGVKTTIFPNESVYFAQHSQLAALKAYRKDLEMKRKRRAHRLPDTPNAADLIELAKSTVRFESVFRLKHLSRMFEGQSVTPYMLSPETLASMFLSLLDSYDLNGSMRVFLNDDELWQIRPAYRLTVALWQRGMDLERLFKADEKRLLSHRKVLKRDYGIDIFLPPPGAIEMPLELGDILRVENFIPVPAAIKADPSLFYMRDMEAEWIAQTRAKGQRGISSQYVSPFIANEEDDECCDE